MPIFQIVRCILPPQAGIGRHKNGAGGVKSVWQDFTPPVKLNKKNPLVFATKFDSFDNRLNQIAEREYNKTLDKLLGQIAKGKE